MKYFAHSTAIIDNNPIIGVGTKIWHWTHICGEAVIGERCSLGQNVFVGNKVVIGDNVKIQNNVSVYDNITLEDDVFCGPSMVFTNVLNPRSSISRKDEYMNTLVKKGATLGANCTIVCGNVIGKNSFVGAGSVVTSDVLDYSLVLGVPARHVGWISEYGVKLDLPLNNVNNESYISRCPKTGQKYQLFNGLVKKIDNE
jgi:UDP-2-acetamido-3-amino-2,3-dideoxy-glucuronate N-acetyltransferase